MNNISFSDWFSSMPERPARKFSAFFAFMGAPVNVVVAAIIPIVIYGFIQKKWSPVCGLGLAVLFYIPANFMQMACASIPSSMLAITTSFLSWTPLTILPLILILLAFWNRPKENANNGSESTGSPPIDDAQGGSPETHP